MSPIRINSNALESPYTQLRGIAESLSTDCDAPFDPGLRCATLSEPTERVISLPDSLFGAAYGAPPRHLFSMKTSTSSPNLAAHPREGPHSPHTAPANKLTLLDPQQGAVLTPTAVRRRRPSISAPCSPDLSPVSSPQSIAHLIVHEHLHISSSPMLRVFNNTLICLGLMDGVYEQQPHGGVGCTGDDDGLVDGVIGLPLDPEPEDEVAIDLRRLTAAAKERQRRHTYDPGFGCGAQALPLATTNAGAIARGAIVLSPRKTLLGRQLDGLRITWPTTTKGSRVSPSVSMRALDHLELDT